MPMRRAELGGSTICAHRGRPSLRARHAVCCANALPMPLACPAKRLRAPLSTTPARARTTFPTHRAPISLSPSELNTVPVPVPVPVPIPNPAQRTQTNKWGNYTSLPPARGRTRTRTRAQTGGRTGSGPRPLPLGLRLLHERHRQRLARERGQPGKCGRLGDETVVQDATDARAEPCARVRTASPRSPLRARAPLRRQHTPPSARARRPQARRTLRQEPRRACVCVGGGGGGVRGDRARGCFSMNRSVRGDDGDDNNNNSSVVVSDSKSKCRRNPDEVSLFIFLYVPKKRKC